MFYFEFEIILVCKNFPSRNKQMTNISKNLKTIKKEAEERTAKLRAKRYVALGSIFVTLLAVGYEWKGN